MLVFIIFKAKTEQITAKDADALIRSESKGGKITTLFVQDGKVIEN